MIGLALALAGLVSFLLMACAHWASLALWQGELGVLKRYVIGTAGIGLVFGGWCLAQAEPVSPILGWAAWAVVAVGAGLGTCVGHGLDALAGLQREQRLLRKMVEREQELPRAAGRGG